jgi:hypothetical protein
MVCRIVRRETFDRLLYAILSIYAPAINSTNRVQGFIALILKPAVLHIRSVIAKDKVGNDRRAKHYWRIRRLSVCRR